VDVQSNLASTGANAVPSPMQGSDVLGDELEHNSVDDHREPEATSPAECSSHDADEVLDSKDNTGAASGQHLQLPDAANASDLNVQLSAVHRVSIQLPGNFLGFLWLH